ncbi:flagellar basal body L-ring protein FlgH [Maridesulfovibrio hydrothermalis]|uniref:Flagellar L-ring protein n=1 Tax=Maridesulfovibrio hydrothermalis AM13 = DSM 14728 TaxID=1121451 RepID=L0RCS4_9BACT|nr:flagellar basal body L-ring protein FlgH [Maridesulfovibrio hydrothermalis]CCO23985.1 Flagellar L-ring protein [Maridesulfovibrio hydrothermalis AM13 = DSM 14728]
MKKSILAVLLCSAISAGCSPVKQAPTPMPVMTPPAQYQAEPVDNPGSLFTSTDSEYLFDDNRARRIGDIVVVTVTEKSSGKHTSNSKAEKENTTGLDVTNFYGGILGAIDPFDLKGSAGTSPMIKSSMSNKFKSTGEAKNESNLSASVACRVVRILPGNVMQIEGARQVRINDETQVLVVRGLLRQRDIGPGNTVQSSYLADAHIEVYGRGVLADKQRPGWLSRVIDNVWPF